MPPAALAPLRVRGSARVTQHHQPGHRCGEGREAGDDPRVRAQGWSRARRASIVAGPIPSIWSSWSTDEMPPCWSRNRRFLGGHRPDPLDRVELLDGRAPEADRPPAAVYPLEPPLAPATDGARGPGRHHDLLTVAEPGCEVDRLDLGPRRWRPRPLDRVVDPRAARQAVDARPGHRPGDVDDDVRPARGSTPKRAPAEPEAPEDAAKLTPSAGGAWALSPERIHRAPTSRSTTATAP